MTTGGQFYMQQRGTIGVPPELIEIENRLDNPTWGLQALKSLIDALELKLDAAMASQLCPVKMNCEQTLTTTAGNKDFIASNSDDGIPVGITAAGADKIKKVVLLMVGRAVNTYDGQNNLDCTTATHNQWQINIDGGAYVDLENDGKADGQMNDSDWECMVQGIVHPFTLSFDITDLITSLTNKIGVRLQNGRSRQDSLIVTADVYVKVMWSL
jgi:hypothetical protein